MSKTFPTKGQMTDVPTTVTYDGVVSMKTVCIALTMTVLNDLKAMAADIMDTYITAPNKKRYGCYLVPSLLRTKSIR